MSFAVTFVACFVPVGVRVRLGSLNGTFVTLESITGTLGNDVMNTLGRRTSLGTESTSADGRLRVSRAPSCDFSLGKHYAKNLNPLLGEDWP